MLYKQQALDLGISIAQAEQHRWTRSVGEATIEYLQQRPEGTSAEEAMEKIVGMNIHQLDLLSLGCSPEQLREKHYWAHTNTLFETYDYVEKRVSEDVSAQKAFEEIKGLYVTQIKALALGLPREAMEGHNWQMDWPGLDDYKSPTLAYLEECPKTIPITQAMDNIRGLKPEEVHRLHNMAKRGVSELSLLPEQVYAGKFDSLEFSRIKNGDPYNTVMPKAWEIISKIPEYDYTQGAVAGIVENKPGLKLPQSLGYEVGKFLSPSEGRQLSLVSKAAYSYATEAHDNNSKATSSTRWTKRIETQKQQATQESSQNSPSL